MPLKHTTDFACGLILFKQINPDSYHFLLVQHHAGHWGFPKGHPEKEEAWLEAACREVQEETGLTSDIDFKILDADIIFEEQYIIEKKKKHVHKSVRYTLAESISPQKITLQAAELKDGRWLTFEQALQLISFKQSRLLLQQALAVLKKNLSK